MKLEDILFYPLYLLCLVGEIVYDIDNEWDNIVARAKRRLKE